MRSSLVVKIVAACWAAKEDQSMPVLQSKPMMRGLLQGWIAPANDSAAISVKRALEKSIEPTKSRHLISCKLLWDDLFLLLDGMRNMNGGKVKATSIRLK